MLQKDLGSRPLYEVMLDHPPSVFMYESILTFCHCTNTVSVTERELKFEKRSFPVIEEQDNLSALSISFGQWSGPRI
jgi:hypothetical protein